MPTKVLLAESRTRIETRAVRLVDDDLIGAYLGWSLTCLDLGEEKWLN
jgi:hypothetical protein